MAKATTTLAATLATATLMAAPAAHAAHGRHARYVHASLGGWHRHGYAAHRHAAYVGGWRHTRRATASAAESVVAVQSGSQVGRASFYSGGGHTANGGFVGSATCAHRFLPFGTKILVTNLANARQAVLTVNDRGPFVRGRLLDVSRGAAGLLGMLHAGVSQIRMQVLGSAG